MQRRLIARGDQNVDKLEGTHTQTHNNQRKDMTVEKLIEEIVLITK